MIYPCNCTGKNADGPAAKFQDKQYGKGKRVHTVGIERSGGAHIIRCTVCGKEKTVGKSEITQRAK